MGANPKSQDFEAASPLEDAKNAPKRVEKAETQTELSATEYQFNEIKGVDRRNYKRNKKNFAVMSMVDPDRQHLSADRRSFSLDEKVRDPLGLAEEERRAVEEMVQGRVTEIEKEAREKARQEGYEAGLEQGKKEAKEEFEKEASVRLQELNSLALTFEFAKSQIYKAHEDFLMRMIYQIARRIVLKEVSVDKDYLRRLSSNIIEKLGTKDNISIKVNPRDLDTIDMLDSELKSTITDLKNLSIIPSDDVHVGGCLVETRWNAIDGSLATQLSHAHEAIIGEKIDETKTSLESSNADGEAAQTESDEGVGANNSEPASEQTDSDVGATDQSSESDDGSSET